ncbi:putative PUG and UBX domain-containing protein [Cryptosporidium canis]|nr:putative PUG and UBX domain-containing protein [Cryptosporidium canis]
MAANEVRELILRVGGEMGRGEEEMNKYVDIIVNKNWYDRVELLRDITSEQWEAMSIPLRLVDAIRRRIGPGGGESPAVEGPGQTEGQQILRDDDVWEFEYFTPENHQIKPSLYNSIESLASIPHGQLKEVTGLIFKIIDSIIREPRKGRIRRIRVRNPRFASTIGCFPEAMSVLLSVGFVQVQLRPSQVSGVVEETGSQDLEEYIELPIAYISRLMDCHHLLAIFCERNKIDHPVLSTCDFSSGDVSDRCSLRASHFNPYVSNISSTVVGSNSEASRRLISSAIEERRRVECEIRKREREIEHGIVDGPGSPDGQEPTSFRPFVIHSSNVQRFDHIVKAINCMDGSEDAEAEDGLSHLDQSEIQRIRDSILGKKPAFKSRANEYLKSLLKTKVHSHSSIRVVFPDKYILHLQFRPNQTTYDLIQSVKDCINPNISSMSWYIYQSPPVSKVTPDKSLTLLRAGFVPNAQLYFKLELPPNHTLQGNYIKAQLINEDI